MAKILIPTRNRPESLGHVLEYMSRFYPGQSVIIADGSTEEYKAHYSDLLNNHQFKLDIDYRPFDEKISFFDRLLTVLRQLDDELIIIGSDDDYPVLNVLREGEAFLNQHPDYVTAMGSSINLYLHEHGDITTKLGFARTISANKAENRAQEFSEWSFSTTYAITRRELLIKRFEKGPHYFLANFYDFNTGILDCISGKIKALDEASYFCTRNYRYSYIRPDDNLIYLRQGQDVLRIMDFFRDEFIASEHMAENKAAKLAKQLFRKRIAQLAAPRLHRRAGFAKTRFFKSPEIQSQYNSFHDLFRANTKYRASMLEKLKFIVDTLKLKPESIDNMGMKQKNESVD